MVRDDIFLEGIVLHSPKLEKIHSFYEALFGLHFAEEKHSDGPKHYSCEHRGILFELYPTKRTVAYSTALGFNIPNLQQVADRMQGQMDQPIIYHQENTVATFTDPDLRNIRLHQSPEPSLKEIFLHGDVEKLRSFYESLLGVDFQEEQDARLPKEYAKHYSGNFNGVFLNLHHDARHSLPDPSFIFRVHDVESTIEPMKKYNGDKTKLTAYGARITDPNERAILFLRQASPHHLFEMRNQKV